MAKTKTTVTVKATTSFVAAPYFAKKGDVLDVPVLKAGDIIARGWAEPVSDEAPANAVPESSGNDVCDDPKMRDKKK